MLAIRLQQVTQDTSDPPVDIFSKQLPLDGTCAWPVPELRGTFPGSLRIASAAIHNPSGVISLVGEDDTFHTNFDDGDCPEGAHMLTLDEYGAFIRLHTRPFDGWSAALFVTCDGKDWDEFIELEAGDPEKCMLAFGLFAEGTLVPPDALPDALERVLRREKPQMKTTV